MSRVGKKPVKIPAGVKVSFCPPVVEISGKAGSIKKLVPPSINLEIKGDEITVQNLSANESLRSLHGLWRTLIQNMVQGALSGFAKDLELHGVGYRAVVQGGRLTLQLGFSHPVEFAMPPGITVSVEASTKINLKGADKELVGLVAAKLRKVKPPEPYKGKGVRYLGEVIQLKQGKTAGTGGSAAGK